MLYPGVGVGICVMREGKVLLGYRKGGYRSDTWCFPGGKLELYEDWKECAVRETREESGIEIKNIRFIGITNDVDPAHGSHYATIFLAADWKAGEASLTEPDKFSSWEWFAWDALPEPLFLSTRSFVEAGYNPFNF
ncbi:NUDIX domain-containing protein [Candidatus Kaiserbacteria bacterium]|nr:NUDIX domain-containing protein [Candidatus Kaiserbacteria bacterium]